MPIPFNLGAIAAMGEEKREFFRVSGEDFQVKVRPYNAALDSGYENVANLSSNGILVEHSEELKANAFAEITIRSREGDASPIKCIAKVIRSTNKEGAHEIAFQFVKIPEDSKDRLEALIGKVT